MGFYFFEGTDEQDINFFIINKEKVDLKMLLDVLKYYHLLMLFEVLIKTLSNVFKFNFPC